MTHSTSISAALDRFYKRVTAKNSDAFLMGAVIFTVMFALGYLTLLYPVIRETGTILGGDGCTQYYPMLISFRRSFLGFFENVSNGSFEFPVMDVNNMFGTDTLAAVKMYAPFFPYYILTVLFPESMVDEFLMGGVILLSFASGLSFINLCRYFKKNMLWAGLFAAFYVFCGNMVSTVMWNPEFFVMTIAFPFMIIGIDKLLHDGSGLALTLSVAWVALGGITFLVYIIPFAGVFALIRLIYVRKENLLINIPKYFGLGILSIVIGVLIAGIFAVPSIISLMNAERPLGGGRLSLWEYFVPSAEYIKNAFSADDISHDRGLSAAIVPVFLYSLLSVKAKGEQRCYSLVMLLLISLPLISYGPNGFMYDLCRWGFIPALYVCFLNVSALPDIVRTDRRDALLTSVGVAVFTAFLLSGLYLAAGIFLAVCGIVNCLPKIREPLYSVVYRLYDRVTAKKEDGRGLHTKTAAVITAVTIITFAAAGFMKSLLPITVGLTGVIVIAFIASAKRSVSAPVLSVLLALVFIAADRLYQSTATFAVYMLDDSEYYPVLRDTYSEADMFGRFHNHRVEAANYTDLTDEEDEDMLLNVPQQGTCLGVADNITVYSDYNCDLGLRYSFPDDEGFSSILNPGFSALLTRCGQDIYSMYSPVYYTGFAGKEPLYSLFGISYTYSSLKDPMIKGLTPIDKPDNELFFFTKMYKYNYAFPVGVTYGNVISGDTFGAFTPAELPFGMMSAVYLEGYDAPTVSPAPELTRRIAYKLDRTVDGKTGYGSEISHNTITVDSDVSGCFLYLTMNGVNAPDKKDVFEKRAYIYLDDIRKVSLNVETGNWPWRRGCTSYTFALGYVENDISRMTFDCEFDFDPDTLTVTAVPFEVFENAYNEQTAQTLKNVSFDGNSVSGHIDLSSDRVLSVGIVYSTGWKAYVDGEPAKLYKSNSVFLGLPLSAGSHDIRLEYSEPYGAEGATVSLIGILSAAAFEVVIRKRKKRVSKPEGSE